MDANGKYAESYTDFSNLIRSAVDVTTRVAGRVAPNDREYYADRIFGKLLCHAITLRRISPSLASAGKEELWDVSSACAIARAAIESYDALAYISIHAVTDEERRFRVLMWKLHAAERRAKMLGLIASASPKVADVQANLIHLREAVTSHPAFEGCREDVKGKVRKGETPAFSLSQSERNKLSEIDTAYYNTVMMILSSHVHTLPLSIHQLMEFQAGSAESLRLMWMPIEYATGFLAKGMQGMQEVFGDSVPVLEGGASRIVDTWSEILRSGVRGVS